MGSLGLAFSEHLRGALRLHGERRDAPITLALKGTALLPGFFSGEPALVDAEVEAPPFLDHARLEGRITLCRSPAELTYDLAQVASGPGGIWLRGRKRRLLADPYAGLTTLALRVGRGAQEDGRATMRFDARGGLRQGLSRLSLTWVPAP